MSKTTELSRHMEAKGVSDTVLGAAVGKSADTIRNYRAGNTLPNAHVAARLAEFFDTTVARLFPESK